MRGVLAAGLAVVALAGCESIYRAPAGGPVAQVVVKNTSLLESQQAKVMHLGADRSRRDWIGDGIFYEYDKSWPVAAEVKAFFEVETLTYAGYTELYCSTFYSFTPRTGRTYVFVPKSVPRAECGATITDSATGDAPADLVQELAK